MKLLRWLLPFVALLVLCGVPGFAQEFNGKVLVTPSLVAGSTKIAPGKAFTVGVRMQFAPGWHTYWQYPGEAGGAPKIDWELPAGFTAGPIQWPIPKAHVDEGNLLTYIYEDDLLLLVEITPPAQLPAGDIPLKAKLRWLVCEKTCIPGEGEVALQLSTGSDGAPANAELFAKWRALLPKSEGAPFGVTWERKADSVTLRITGLPKEAAAQFYPLPPRGVTFDHPKASALEADGTRSITLPITEGGSADLAWAGVLVTSKEGGPREGWSISVPPAAASGTQPATSATASTPHAPPSRGLAWKLLLAFLGGLIMNVMPCVLPVIALKIFGFVKQAGEEPERVFRLGLAFAAGVFAFFLGLAAIVSQLRGAFNFGYQFQNPWLLTGLIALVFVFSLNLLGVFEIALGSGTATTLSQLSGREGYGGAFLHGLFTTLLGTSCTAPFLSTSLGFAVTQPAPIVFLLFAAIAAGMSLPYLLLTARPAWLRYLPKPGVWMERAKQLMGFVMLAVVVWLLGVLGSRGADASSAVSWFLLFLGLACWIYGAFARSTVAWVAIVLVLAAGWFGFLRGAFAQSAGTKMIAQASPDGIAWQPYSDEKLAAAIASGAPAFIDFTADWCVNCKVYERVVLNTEPVGRAFREKKIVAFKADWTNADPEVSRALKRSGRVGVPLYVLYRPGETQPVVLDALTSNILLGELAPIKVPQVAVAR